MMKKRLLSVLVCTCMLFTMLSAAMTGVSAAETDSGITLSPEALTFSAVYGALPQAQTVTVENTGDTTAHLSIMDAEGFTVSELSESELEPGKTATFTVQPEKDLKAGTYEGNLTIRESGAAVAWLPLTYTVKPVSQDALMISINVTEHGSVSISPESANEGDTMTITVKPDSGYTLETLNAEDSDGNALELTAVEIGKTYTFRMPASDAAVAASFMEDNSVLNYFVDVPNDAYYFEAVKWAAENDITGGIGDYRFGPDVVCTRAQIVAFLWRAAGKPEPKSKTMPFTDVKANSYYYDAVKWAVENGITAGTSQTTFSPDENCTRGQIVTFLYRSEQAGGNGLTGLWSFKNPFTDVDMDSYYGKAVMWAVANEITLGTSATTFSPDDSCTRAQIVTFIWRTMVH